MTEKSCASHNRPGRSCGGHIHFSPPPLSVPDISNKPCFRQKYLGVPDGSDGSDATWYPVTENPVFPMPW